jgi:hypothetical protein
MLKSLNKFLSVDSPYIYKYKIYIVGQLPNSWQFHSDDA